MFRFIELTRFYNLEITEEVNLQAGNIQPKPDDNEK